MNRTLPDNTRVLTPKRFYRMNIVCQSQFQPTQHELLVHRCLCFAASNSPQNHIVGPQNLPSYPPRQFAVDLLPNICSVIQGISSSGYIPIQYYIKSKLQFQGNKVSKMVKISRIQLPKITNHAPTNEITHSPECLAQRKIIFV